MLQFRLAGDAFLTGPLLRARGFRGLIGPNDGSRRKGNGMDVRFGLNPGPGGMGLVLNTDIVLE
ncbi:MAG: hypothetical protein H6Q05_167 [Acidobacteria bacterium]|nr:hypothetical protein [Acidobacteriota bacterium]